LIKQPWPSCSICLLRMFMMPTLDVHHLPHHLRLLHVSMSAAVLSAVNIRHSCDH
jgi:hypothetical protein